MAPPGRGGDGDRASASTSPTGPLELRWYQIPLSSARAPRTGLFSPRFQASLQRYQQLRQLKHLRVGRPFTLPPPGLLQAAPASPEPPGPRQPRPSAGRRAVAVPRARPPPRCRRRRRRRRRGVGPRPAAAPPCRAKETPGAKGSAASGHRPAGPTRARGGRSSPPEQAVPGPAPVSAGCQLNPVVVLTCPGGDCGHRGAGKPGQARRRLPGMARVQASPEDSEDILIPLRDLLLVGDEPRCPAERSRLDPLANSLDPLVEEQREQRQAAAPRSSPEWVRSDTASPQESPDEDTPLSEEHRLLLARFAVKPGLIPPVHPGEPVFCARPLPAPALDARGLQPQSALEGLFLRASPAGQAAFVREGRLSLLYRCVPACPLPVLRWLFQLTALCPDTANASQALWEINVHRLSTAGEPWCPTVPEIGQAFCRLGANLGALHRLGLLPLELCPADRRCPDLPRSPDRADPKAPGALALATQLGDICKLLALCVVAQPGRYPDRARLALLTLLCFLGLDRALRCQPLPDLQHLLHCLLEGIGDWQEQLPDLCLSLCQLSQHHHNLVAIVRLLPDVTVRGRELRRHLSLCIMARLLGEPLGTVLPGRVQAELRALCHLLALVRPATLQRLVLAECQNEPEDPDQEACYLSHSLLILANAVVGAERLPDEQRGHLEHLCAQLDRQLGAGLREGSGLLFRTQLKGLAALTYVKWQDLLAQCPPWTQPRRGRTEP
ncbi:protein FAM178B [Apteryx mantelli]|uniref:Protein FAM178B n=1 Tax=Apteryx mantelli TaxID=2696672 RepID=A0ABM4FTU2_9AVES